ncbi:hypothetical protein I203_100032 [Kwoniella mangroviensis CBS 8507]|uniref:uncharacterized protein n=1 Tax=Kwoniella mangroviensis CBS 8507 TaxID=1296122 RepID=UPI00080CE205|nr:uncharacterized protein I203_08005 [Kwoniella mangroviensis CBS 8507]OCF63024.1 hypothetical protein I203_08005 [Kwoniella mangroviensis CBS 8507]
MSAWESNDPLSSSSATVGSTQLSKQDNQGDHNSSSATATSTDLINKLQSWGMPAYLNNLPSTHGEEEWESSSLSPLYARMLNEYFKIYNHSHDHEITKATINLDPDLDVATDEPTKDKDKFRFGLIDERGIQMSREDPDISRSRKEAERYWNECVQQVLVKGEFGSSMARGIAALIDGTTVFDGGEGENGPEGKSEMEEYYKMRNDFKDWFLTNGDDGNEKAGSGSESEQL